MGESDGYMSAAPQTAPRNDAEGIGTNVWVVGVDGSECSRHAALWAVAHAPGRADELRLTTAWSIPVAPALPPVGPMTRYWDVESFESSAHASSEKLATEIAAGLDMPVKTVVSQGQAASVLLECAHHASLLVIGSRGRGGFTRLLLGSTSTQCATHAQVPTVVIPTDSPVQPSNNIVVAVDGSENSLSAVRWALDFADPAATIECVYVWDVTPVVVGAEQFYFPEANGLARERFEQQIDAILAEHPEGSTPKVTQRFVDGRPRSALVEAGNAADLLVMGARGHGAIGAALLGSISTWLLHHVTRPMVIVPHGAEPDELDRAGDAGQD